MKKVRFYIILTLLTISPLLAKNKKPVAIATPKAPVTSIEPIDIPASEEDIFLAKKTNLVPRDQRAVNIGELAGYYQFYNTMRNLANDFLDRYDGEPYFESLDNRIDKVFAGIGKFVILIGEKLDETGAPLAKKQEVFEAGKRLLCASLKRVIEQIEARYGKHSDIPLL